MKKIILICGFLAATMLGFAQEAQSTQDTKRVAILEVVDKEGKLTYSQKLMLRSNLAKAVTNTEGFEAYDRTDIDAILNEQDFQRTGMVSDAQIKKLGEMTGAAYILVAEGAVADEANMFVTAKIMNVETGRIIMTESALVSMAPKNMHRGCASLASNLFHGLAVTGVSVAVASKVAGQNKAEEKKKAEEAAAAKKAEQAELAAQAKEQKRIEEERIRQEKLEAQEQKRLEEERARQAKIEAQEQKRLEEERARQEKIEAQEREKQEKLLSEEREREQQRLEKERKEAEEAERLKHSITKVSNDEYRLEGSTMDRKAYEQFIYNNCPDAWKKHVTAKRCIITGWTFLGVGIALSSAWGMLPLGDYYVSNQDAKYYITEQTQYEWQLTGIISGSIGAGLALVSVPLLASGYGMKNNSYKVYNKNCINPSKPALSINLQANQNGLGIALNF